MPGDSRDIDLLPKLLKGGKDAGAAWEEFLRTYSNLFLKIIWQYEKDHDNVMEKYLHVCSALAKDEFSVLRKFRREHGENPPKFTTWLGAVVRNLCVDAHRSVHGRKRLPKALLGFPETERIVFELYYWRGFTPEEIQRHLASRRNGIVENVPDVLERIEGALLRLPEEPAHQLTHIAYDDRNAAMASGPEEPSIDIEALDRWLTQLSPEDRLLIRLKFWDEMTYEEMAAIFRTHSENQIQAKLRNALRNLRAMAEKER